MLDDKTKAYLNTLLEDHNDLLRKYKFELNSLPKGELGVRLGRKKNSSPLYCHYIENKRVGITKNDDLIYKLARKKYLQKAIKMMETNRGYLERLVKHYESPFHTNIISQFPPHYAVLMNQEEARWNEKKRLWLAEDYEESTYNPDEKVHVTAKNLHVRSKSEVIIAERLDYYNVPYRYEQMLYINSYPFAPDFTILTKKGIKYWEHCGRTDKPDYIRKHNWKCTMYEYAGIVQWKNYIITYDDENGNIDTRIIDSEIVNKLL